jgi:hypothetical protein
LEALAEIAVGVVVGSTFAGEVEAVGIAVGIAVAVGCKAAPLDNVLLRIKRGLTTHYAGCGWAYGWP